MRARPAGVTPRVIDFLPMRGGLEIGVGVTLMLQFMWLSHPASLGVDRDGAQSGVLAGRSVFVSNRLAFHFDMSAID